MVRTRDGLTARLGKLEKEVKLFGRKMDIFNEEHLQLQHGHRDHEERLTELERKPN